ncbi:MAG: AAA family ATPase [Micavibrio sp.]
MSKNLRRDFHRVAYTNLNVFIKMINDFATQRDLIKAHASAPAILTNGRSISQIVLDDLLNAFTAIMKDAPDDKIPTSFYKQILSAREGRDLTDAEVQTHLDAALAEKRAAKHDEEPQPPEFMLLFNDSVPMEVSQNMVNNWMNVIRVFSQLMFTEEAIDANKKAGTLLQHVAMLNNELLNKTMSREGAIANIVGGGKKGGANDNKGKGKPQGDGVVLHRAEDIKDVDAEMARLVGLDEPKMQVKEIRARVKYKKAMIDAGLLTGDKASMDHYIFRGPPGTGKTTFGRFVGKIYKDANLLDVGHVVECSRVSLVGGFVGSTALKTQEVVDSAVGGVLFVDEAYSLFGTGNDFGKEALEVILRAMEVHKGNLIVVFAGYPDKMDELIRSNPGLTRRFKHTVNFKDFQMDELMEIFDRNLRARNMTITDDARNFVQSTLQQIKTIKGSDFGNAGTVENIVDLLLDKLAVAVEADGTVDKVQKMVKSKIEVPAKLKVRLTEITIEEAQKIKPQNEITQNEKVVGFDFAPK